MRIILSAALHMRYTLLVLLSGLTAAASILIGEVTISHFEIAPLSVVVVGNAVGGAVLMVGAGRSRLIIANGLRWRDWLRLPIAAVCIYVLGNYLLYSAVALIGAGKTALFDQLEAIFVIALAVAFLGERLSAGRWLAGLLAICGATLIAFDPQALRLSAGRGELFAVFGPLAVATGIVVMKPLLDKSDALGATAWMMVIGPLAVLAVFPGAVELPVRAIPLALVAAMGVLRAVAWLTYNIGLQQIGAARTTILFLSFPLFGFLGQMSLGRIAPQLGLRLPAYPLVALAGGVFIGSGMLLLEWDAKRGRSQSHAPPG